MTTKTKQERRLASPVTVWRCAKHEYDWEGGWYWDIKYAKTAQDMVIYKLKGYTCTEHTENI